MMIKNSTNFPTRPIKKATLPKFYSERKPLNIDDMEDAYSFLLRVSVTFQGLC